MKFTVTGPGVEKVCPSGEIGISAAITLASDVEHRYDGEASFYVRDEDGVAFGRVDRLADSGVEVHRYQPAERAPASGRAPGRRPPAATPTTTEEEDSMASTPKTKPKRSSDRSAAAGPREAQQREQREQAAAPKPAKSAPAPAAAAKTDAAKNGEKPSGGDLFKGVQAALREAKIGTVKPHEKGLYSRLMDGKRTIGYIVTRKTGVRAYPNALASAMPNGLSFKKCKIGDHHYGRGEVILDVESAGDYKDVVSAMKAAKDNPIPRAEPKPAKK